MSVEMGKYSYGNIEEFGRGEIVVGKFCSMALDIKAVFFNDHRMDWISTYQFAKKWGLPEVDDEGSIGSNRLIIIENDVWIGRGVTLLPGAQICNGAVVGAFSIVAGTIPPYTIAVGNPAKPFRKRFSDKQIQKLLQIQWWNWKDKKIKRFAYLLSSTNIDKFISKSTRKRGR